MHLVTSSEVPFTWVSVALLVGFAYLAISCSRQYFRLSHIPGPFLARFSNLPRLYWVYKRDAHNVHIAQHRKYVNSKGATAWAPLVRYGPNAVSVGSASAIDTVYRMRGDPLLKSDFYSVIPPMRKGTILPTIFATQDEPLHRMLKRPIAAVYSMSNLVSFEPLVDSTVDVFRHELDRRFVETGQTCDLGTWLQYFAFDVIGEITFSKRLGFLEEGRDVEGIMTSIWQWFEYVALVGQMPWLDSLWVKNTLVSRLRPAKWSPMVQFANKREEERRAMSASEKERSQANDRDFLSRFMTALEKDPSIPPWALRAWTSSNIIAGSDTTAIYLRTMLHQLLTHPATLAKLRAELDEAAARGALSKTATWKESTIVGMNAWVVHRDPEVFGPDADAWRPERWLEGDEARIKRMDAGLLAFGAGHRVCLGKHISYLEVFKLVPTLLQAYDIELVDGGKSFTVQNRWFVPQSGFHVRLSKREPASANI
ncbi:hypothetical protein G7054_g12368 [Neopestalotiopsis clavispora]|nr:hypothetical protein G7054_g12368 [Neopestalotiopsis clavispora]